MFIFKQLTILNDTELLRAGVQREKGSSQLATTLGWADSIRRSSMTTHYNFAHRVTAGSPPTSPHWAYYIYDVGNQTCDGGSLRLLHVACCVQSQIIFSQSQVNALFHQRCHFPIAGRNKFYSYDMGMNLGWTTMKPREKPKKGQGIAKFSPVWGRCFLWPPRVTWAPPVW